MKKATDGLRAYVRKVQSLALLLKYNIDMGCNASLPSDIASVESRESQQAQTSTNSRPGYRYLHKP